jgi:hypothetical protein
MICFLQMIMVVIFLVVYRLPRSQVYQALIDFTDEFFNIPTCSSCLPLRFIRRGSGSVAPAALQNHTSRFPGEDDIYSQ